MTEDDSKSLPARLKAVEQNLQHLVSLRSRGSALTPRIERDLRIIKWLAVLNLVLTGLVLAKVLSL
jgi:hypothetical protein